MTDEEFAKTLKYKIGDIVTVRIDEGTCETCDVEIVDIDIKSHQPSRLQNPYKIKYEWGETRWTDFRFF